MQQRWLGRVAYTTVTGRDAGLPVTRPPRPSAAAALALRGILALAIYAVIIVGVRAGHGRTTPTLEYFATGFGVGAFIGRPPLHGIGMDSF
jgi:hypothetical protein